MLSDSGEDAVAWAIRGDRPERAALYKAIVEAVAAKTEGWDQIVTWYGNELKRAIPSGGRQVIAQAMQAAKADPKDIEFLQSDDEGEAGV